MRIVRTLILCPVWVLLASCQSARGPMVTADELPGSWATPQTQAPVTPANLPDNWLASLQMPALQPFVDAVIAGNYSLAQQAQAVALAREQVVFARADRLPAIGLGAGAQRGRSTASSAVADSYTVSASLAVEIDLWGSLSAAQRQARLDLAAAQLRYQTARRDLVAAAVVAAGDLITAQQLQQLFDQRLQNLREAVDVIQRGYRSGLNPALDVYLAQTTLQQQRANVASQRQVSFRANTTLELLTADYPDASLHIDAALPALAPMATAVLPSQVLLRRADVQAAWLDLLAEDAGLAIAQRNLFPSLNLSASLSDTDGAVRNLLDGGQLAWTVAASLAQPLFQGGRLRALKRQAKARVLQAEQRYLQVVYDAFAEVENALQAEQTLNDQLQAFIAAQEHAHRALQIANDQYQRGLVAYTTVLESQRRAFDAETTVIQLHNQQFQNRVALHRALGGEY